LKENHSLKLPQTELEKFPGIPAGIRRCLNSREFSNGNSRWPWFIWVWRHCQWQSRFQHHLVTEWCHTRIKVSFFCY